MFFRKLLGNNDTKAEKPSGPPAGMQTMGANLQRRFAKGIQYNMKIIIKGDRNVGKTCLFHRLQGHKFKEEYIPTDEIQVASIMWNYKATDDIVKVEVWDVVDKGKKKKKTEGLKLDNSIEGTSSDVWGEGATAKKVNSCESVVQNRKVGKDTIPHGNMGIYEDTCLDAEFVDVYKGTQGVILVMDITKQWTFDYIQREIHKVPHNIPVLVLANHRDMGHHRTCSEDQVRMFIDELHRPEGAAQIRYAESSMRNGFGLKYIHKFFNLPFLQLQRETLLKQLEVNAHEIQTTNQELTLHEESEDQNYDLFLAGLTNRRREQAEQLAQKALEDARRQQEEERAAAAAAAAAAAQQNKTVSAPTTPVAPPTGTLREAPPAKPIPGLDLSKVVPKTTAPVTLPVSNAVTMSPNTSKSAPVTPTSHTEKSSGFMGRLFGNKNKQKPKENPVIVPEVPKSSMPSVRSVDDFIPEEGLDASFLEDAKEEERADAQATEEESSSEEEGNPLVAGFQDDVDLDDEPTTMPKNSSSRQLPTDVVLSSDDDDGDDDADRDSEVEAKKQLAKSEVKLSTPDECSTSERQKSPSPSLNNSIDLNNPEMQPRSNGHLKSALNHCTQEEIQQSPSPAADSKPEVFHNGRIDDDDDGDVNVDDDDKPSNAVTVLEDTEDISDEEVTTSSKPVDSGLATDTTIENDGSSASDTKPSMGLVYEDLSVLEKGFDFTTGLPRVESASSDLVVSPSRVDTDTDASSSSRKKKKHKNKDKDPEKLHKKHKHKKHKDQDMKNGEAREKTKKKKKSKQDIESFVDADDDLEAFLGSPTPGDGLYESL